jgi:magnesium-transporting ATPase (P-type)
LCWLFCLSVELKNLLLFNNAETESPDQPYSRSTRKEIRGNDPSMVKEFSLTVDGQTIDLILESKQLSSLFFRMASYAMVVIACRVTPKHKALFVEQTSRFSPSCISTLAVGI